MSRKATMLNPSKSSSRRTFSRQYMENDILDCFIYSFTFIKYYSDDMLYKRVIFILDISF